ncbi:hypothetical protein GEMRC1_010441 [Eukaryota sp. GEM-RC1]
MLFAFFFLCSVVIIFSNFGVLGHVIKIAPILGFLFGIWHIACSLFPSIQYRPFAPVILSNGLRSFPSSNKFFQFGFWSGFIELPTLLPCLFIAASVLAYTVNMFTIPIAFLLAVIACSGFMLISFWSYSFDLFHYSFKFVTCYRSVALLLQGVLFCSAAFIWPLT